MTSKLLILSCLGLMLSACSERPEGTLTPLGHTVPGASVVNMLTATSRAASDSPGVGFSDVRGQGVALENVLISVPPDDARQAGELVYPTKGAVNPQTEFAVAARKGMSAADAAEWFRHTQPAGKGELLIFVHGFNTRHEEAVYRFAQLVHDADITAAPILFTWPSRGSVFDYLYDRESANYSRKALEDMIESASAAPEIKGITIMAHSMGSWLTMEALHDAALRKGGLSPKIRNVILASPDVDVDVFGRQLDDIDTRRTQITVFTSVDDRALLASRRLAGGKTRLGQINLETAEARRAVEGRGVTVIDLSELKSDNPLNHSRFASSPEAVQIIGQRLIDGQRLSDSRTSFGETLQATAVGTLRTVGSTVSAAGSLPGALVSEGGRDDLNAHLGDVSGNFGDTILTATGQ